MDLTSIVVSAKFFRVTIKKDKILTPEELASNFLKLHPDSIIYSDQNNSRKWNYEQGLIMEGFFRTWEKSGRTEYLNYVKKKSDYFIVFGS